jgi:hypothetical protein
MAFPQTRFKVDKEERGMESAAVPRLVRRKAFSKTPKLCPSCLSRLEKLGELGGWLLPQNYYCPRCGYEGYAYLENTAKGQNS